MLTRHLTAIGAALLLLGLAACADVAARPSPSPTARHSASVTTATESKPTPATTGDVATTLRARVTAPFPLLLPAAVPSGMQAATVSASATSYMVEYSDDTHARTITVISDAPMGVNGPHQTMRMVPFRGVSATYFIFDTTDPTSERRLFWREQAANHYYSLFATGFTEAEFFQIAGSLQPV